MRAVDALFRFKKNMLTNRFILMALSGALIAASEPQCPASSDLFSDVVPGREVLVYDRPGDGITVGSTFEYVTYVLPEPPGEKILDSDLNQILPNNDEEKPIAVHPFDTFDPVMTIESYQRITITEKNAQRICLRVEQEFPNAALYTTVNRSDYIPPDNISYDGAHPLRSFCISRLHNGDTPGIIPETDSRSPLRLQGKTYAEWDPGFSGSDWQLSFESIYLIQVLGVTEHGILNQFRGCGLSYCRRYEILTPAGEQLGCSKTFYSTTAQQEVTFLPLIAERNTPIAGGLLLRTVIYGSINYAPYLKPQKNYAYVKVKELIRMNPKFSSDQSDLITIDPFVTLNPLLRL